jgi:D-alanine-D-alanine ligase
VGVLFGGKSAEHEVSLMSAKNVIEAMDKDKYEVIPIGINKAGEWFLHEDFQRCLINGDDAKMIQLRTVKESVAVVPKEVGSPLVSLSGNNLNRSLDVVFPVLHGTYGEDGTVQGLLKLANVPFVGAGVLASAVSMDKDVMKRLLRDAGVPTAKFIVVPRHESKTLKFEYVKRELGLPFFVKPANLGSSVGIYKIKTEADFYEKVPLAFEYDRKILFEEYIPGREIECSVLGNEHPIASLPGEVIPQHEFYSYEAKYLDENGALFEIPAKLPLDLIHKIQQMAMEAYKVLCCEGMARVDMFLKEDGQVILNELNTIPGFTRISMYPKMWMSSGMSYPEIIDKLIELALKRFKDEQSVKTTFLGEDIPEKKISAQEN